MKLSSLCLAIILATSLTGCKKIAEKTEFDMDYTQTVVIQSSTGINLPFNILSPDVETNSESTFSVNNTRKDLIEEILLNSIRLDLTSPSNADFSFLESIEIYLSADGLAEIKIAWMDNVPNAAGNSLNLTVTNSDLKEYIKKDEIDLRINTVTDEFITSDHSIDVVSSFHVDAEIFGL